MVTRDMNTAGPHPTVSKTEFKARALEIMRRAEETGEPVIITDRGRPVLKLRRHYGNQAAIRAALRGSVIYQGDIVSPLPKEVWGACT